MDKYIEYFKRGNEILKDVNENITFYHPEKSLPLLKESAENFLKTLIHFYEIQIEKNFPTLEDLIDIIEDKTTIKFPPFKDFIIDLEFSFAEGGCSNPVLFKNLPTYYIQAVEDLKYFVIDEIGIWNLEV
jgi:hypothetical protein